MVIAKEQTKKYEQTMTPFVIESWPLITQTRPPSTLPHSPKPPWSPPTRYIQKPIITVPIKRSGRRPHLSM